jgi:tetratricopeptide (TPR) repeat protein
MRFAEALLVQLLLLAGTTAGDLLRQAEERIQREQFSSAEALLEQTIRQEPGNVQALYRLGYVQYRQRKLSEARQSFAKVVKIAPPAYNSRYFLGRIALLENKHREAIEWLEPVVASKETVFDAASQLASAYSGAARPQEALSFLRIAVAEAPWDGSLYYRLGKLHQQLGQDELAREAFDNSRRLNNASREDVGAIMRVSQAIGEGHAAQARQLGGQILDRADAEPSALVALGVIYGNANLQTEALDVFERAARGDPDLFQARFNQGLALLKLGRAPEAMEPLGRAVELLPQSFEANMTYGLASVMTQRYPEATGALERAWKIDSTNTRVGALLGTAYLRTGAAAKAVPILRKVADAGNDPAPLLLLVDALNATEDTNGALDAARLAQKRFPKTPQAHMAVAQQLARLGRYREARPAFEETLKLAPGQPEAELGVADTLQKEGEHAEAAGHYRAALNSPSTMLAARVGLARSLVALRELEEARRILEDGLPLHPSEVSLRLELSRVYARLGKSDLAAEQTKIVEQLRTAPQSR